MLWKMILNSHLKETSFVKHTTTHTRTYTQTHTMTTCRYSWYLSTLSILPTSLDSYVPIVLSSKTKKKHEIEVELETCKRKRAEKKKKKRRSFDPPLFLSRRLSLHSSASFTLYFLVPSVELCMLRLRRKASNMQDEKCCKMCIR